MLGRNDAAKAEAAAGRLEQSRAVLVQVPGSDLERVRAEQEVVWRTRLEDLLEQDPGVEQELRALIAEVQAQAAGSAGPVEQHVAAFDVARRQVRPGRAQVLPASPGR